MGECKEHYGREVEYECHICRIATLERELRAKALEYDGRKEALRQVCEELAEARREVVKAAATAHARGRREALEEAIRAVDADTWRPTWLIDEPAYFQEDPPNWAQDPINGDAACRCGYCNAWMTVVRPGKVQCDACGDGLEAAWIIRLQIAAAIRALAESGEGGKR